jgi:hypothetical protein
MKGSTIKEIKAGFVHRAADFKVDKQYPSKTELQETFRKLEENALTVPCFVNECDEFGYAVLLCKESDWNQYHANKQTGENKNAVITAGQAGYTIVSTTGTTIPVISIQTAPVHGKNYACISLISKWSTSMTKLISNGRHCKQCRG